METHSTTKSLPKGYSEIAHFVDELYQEFLDNNWDQKQLTSRIDLVWEHIDNKRFSIGPALLHLLVEMERDDSKCSLVILLISRCEPRKLLPSIISAFALPQATDRIRRRLLLLLDEYQEIDHLAEVVPYFSHPEHLAEDALRSLLSYIGAMGEESGNIFHCLANQETHFYRMLASDLAHRNDESSIWLLGSLAEFSDDKVVEIAIKGLGESQNLLAYELLENCFVSNKSKDELRKKAMDKLVQSGIAKNSPKQFVPHKCYVSWIDGNGNRILVMSQRISGRNRLGMVTFMLNEAYGIQDCSSWSEISSFEMESVIKSLETQVGLRQIDYERGIHIVEDALWMLMHSKKILSPNFLSVRRVLGTLKLSPKFYTINERLLGIENVAEHLASLVENSEKLLQDVPFCEWGVDTNAAQEFVKNRRSLLEGHKIRKATVAQFVKTTLEPKREIWKRRFLLTADFLYAISPRGYRSQIDMCLALYMSIDRGAPLATIPFMVCLAERAIEKLREKFLQDDIAVDNQDLTS
jgi:hypothetical protein